MNTLTNTEMNIANIYCVIKSTMKHGQIPLKKSGRHSDCFVFVINGTTRYDFDRYSITVKPGGVLYLSKGSVYSMDIISDEYEVIFTDFDFDYNHNVCPPLKSEFFHRQNASYSSFESLYNFWVEKKPRYKTRCMSVIYNILYNVVSEQSSAYHPSKSYTMIKRSVDYINENYNRPDLSIEYAAECSGISSVHFRRIFKEIYMTSPIKYVNALRIERAKELLMYDAINSVSQIAELCGYSDVYYFSKIFKSQTGVSPTVYRKKNHI